MSGSLSDPWLLNCLIVFGVFQLVLSCSVGFVTFDGPLEFFCTGGAAIHAGNAKLSCF